MVFLSVNGSGGNEGNWNWEYGVGLRFDGTLLGCNGCGGSDGCGDSNSD